MADEDDSVERPVLLRHAWWWTCPNCNIEQFAKSVPFEPSDEDADWIMEDYGLTIEEAKEMYCVCPPFVECSTCGSEWTTEEEFRLSVDGEPIDEEEDED